MKRTILAAAAVATLAATGCGSDAPEERRPATSPMDASETPSEDPEDQFAPNVGDRALSVGQTRKGMNISMRLAEIRYPYPPAEFREPFTPGNVLVGLRLRECVIAPLEEEIFSSGNSDWSVVTPSGQEFGGSGSSYDDFPTPKFPEYVTLTEDRCLKGWITLEVPEGTRIAGLVYRPGGQTVAEWLPKGDGSAT